MNLLLPFRLIPPRFLYLNAAILGLIILISVTVSKSAVPGADPAKALFFLLMAPMVIAGLLTTMLGNALHWAPSAMLPGVQRKLVAWSALVAAGVSIVWGALTTLNFPVVPFPVAISLSGALMILALPLSRRGWSNPRVFALATAYATGHLLPDLFWDSVAQAIFSHAWKTTAVAAMVAFLSLRVARNPRRLKRLELTQPSSRTAPTLREWLRGRRWRSVPTLAATPTYPRGPRSLLGWVRTIYAERGGSGFTVDIFIAALFIVLAIPAMAKSGGYPEGWYRLIFDRGSGGSPVILFMLWCTIVGLGCIAPTPRKDHLYPISRQRRANLAFGSLLIVWSSVILALVGLPVLFAVATGEILGLEMPRDALVSFLAPAGVTLPALALIQWSRLQLEGRIDFAMAFVLIVAFVGMSVGCTVASLAEARVAIGLSSAAIALTLPIFYAGVRLFYNTDDLVTPGAGSGRVTGS